MQVFRNPGSVGVVDPKALNQRGLRVDLPTLLRRSLRVQPFREKVRSFGM